MSRRKEEKRKVPSPTKYAFQPRRTSWDEKIRAFVSDLPFRESLLNRISQAPMYGYRRGGVEPLGYVPYSRSAINVAINPQEDIAKILAHEAFHYALPYIQDRKPLFRAAHDVRSKYGRMFPEFTYQYSGPPAPLQYQYSPEPSGVRWFLGRGGQEPPPFGIPPLEMQAGPNMAQSLFPSERLMEFTSAYPASRRNEELLAESIAQGWGILGDAFRGILK